MRVILFAQSFFLCSMMLSAAPGRARAQATTDANVDGKSDVGHVLRVQQDAWNRHDLEGFMAGYWNSPELTFFSGAKEKHGWQAMIERYRAAYVSPGHEMGKLEFSGLRIEMLGADAAFARGSWQLTMSDGKTPHGLFTLAFRKFPEAGRLCTTTLRQRNSCFWASALRSPYLTSSLGPGLGYLLGVCRL